jgi:hypothetical protein
MNTDDILIPLANYKKYPKNFTSNDGPRPVLTIQYFGPARQIFQPRNPALYGLCNDERFTIEPLQFKTLIFNTIVFTSIKAVSLLFADDLLYRHGLTYVVNNIPTNDTFLSIKIFNTLPVSKTFEKDTLSFTCLTLIA